MVEGRHHSFLVSPVRQDSSSHSDAVRSSSPSNLVVWSLVFLALVEPIGLVLIVLARHGAGLHHRAHFVVLVLEVELVPVFLVWSLFVSPSLILSCPAIGHCEGGRSPGG